MAKYKHLERIDGNVYHGATHISRDQSVDGISHDIPFKFSIDVEHRDGEWIFRTRSDEEANSFVNGRSLLENRKTRMTCGYDKRYAATPEEKIAKAAEQTLKRLEKLSADTGIPIEVLKAQLKEAIPDD